MLNILRLWEKGISHNAISSHRLKGTSRGRHLPRKREGEGVTCRCNKRSPDAPPRFSIPSDASKTAKTKPPAPIPPQRAWSSPQDSVISVNSRTVHRATPPKPFNRRPFSPSTETRFLLNSRPVSSANSTTTSCTETPGACPDRRSGAPFAPSARPRGSRRGSASACPDRC